MLRVLLTSVLGCVLFAASAAADEDPHWRVAPRVRVSGGYDSNYAYAATDPVQTATAGVEAGLRLDWLPTLRTRVSMRHAYAQDGFVPFVKGAKQEFGGGYDGALEWAYLPSLRTSIDASAGGFTYVAPEAWGGRRSRGAYASLAAQATPGRALIRPYAEGWLASDAVTAAAQRDDVSVAAGLELRYDPRAWLGLGAWGQWQRGQSTGSAFRYDGLAAGATLRLGLWQGAEVTGWGGVRRRDYGPSRLDTRLTAGAALQQRIGAANRLSFSGEWNRNRSNVFAYERQTAKLVWECEPAWLF